MKKIVIVPFLLFPSLCFGWMTSQNLVFQDRFNGTLSAWTEVETGGSIDLQARNDSSFFSPQMKLNDTSGSDVVSATHSYTEPAGAYNLEYDEIIVTDGDICVMNLLDSGDNVIASVTHGVTNDTVSFNTDNDTAATAAWNNNTRRQVIVRVNPATDVISCWISEADTTYGSFVSVGAKSYSGTAIAKMQFTTSTSTAVAYIDDVRIYTTDTSIAMIGDSITDGKPLWSTHPGYSGRLAAAENETSPPSYHLTALVGSSETAWVMNRGFGGSYTEGVDDYIQEAVIDQGASRVFIGIGHNDIMDGIVVATMETNVLSAISQFEAAGLSKNDIILGNIMPSGYINTGAEQANKYLYNLWLKTLCQTNGYVYVDRDLALRNPANVNALLSTYDNGDGTHLSSAGSAAMAAVIFNSVNAIDQNVSDDGNNCMYAADDKVGQVLYDNNCQLCAGKNSVGLLFF